LRKKEDGLMFVIAQYGSSLVFKMLLVESALSKQLT
jgi:hypothetical protein